MSHKRVTLLASVLSVNGGLKTHFLRRLSVEFELNERRGGDCMLMHR
jgi:hypothetical protein